MQIIYLLATLASLYLFSYAEPTISWYSTTSAPYSGSVYVQGTGFTPEAICQFVDTTTLVVYNTTCHYSSPINGTCDVPALSSGAPSTATYDVYVYIPGQEPLSNLCGFHITSGGAHSDPHFYGFHGEKMEVKRDENAANQLFHLYCSSSITITTLFYEYPDKLLFMTKFWVRLGDTLFTLGLSTKPNMITSSYEGPYFMKELGRFRINFDDGHLEWDDNKLRVVYKYLQINFSSKIYLNNSPYLDISMNTRSSDFEDHVTGIIGRTLHKPLSNEEFEQYLPFKATVSDVVTFSCGHNVTETLLNSRK